MRTRVLLTAIPLLLCYCGGQQSDLESEIATPVTVEELKKKPIEEYLVVTGTAFAAKEVELKSEISAYYFLERNPETGRPFALGDRITSRQILIRLEDTEYENNIKIESQKLNLEISEREYEKQKSLYEKGGVTLRELKNAELAFINARYGYDQALVQLAKMKITSPFEGIIVELPYYTEGTRVPQNSIMVRIMDYSRLYMEGNLPAKDLGRVKHGQPVRVMNYTLPEDTLEGTINQVSPAVDAATRTFKTSLFIANPERTIRPGMFMKAEIVVARNDSAIVVPRDVVLSRQRGKAVFVVERSAAQERIISTGLENPDAVEVTNGLRENERLVVKGFETLRSGSKVKIIR